MTDKMTEQQEALDLLHLIAQARNELDELCSTLTPAIDHERLAAAQTTFRKTLDRIRTLTDNHPSNPLHPRPTPPPPSVGRQ